MDLTAAGERTPPLRVVPLLFTVELRGYRRWQKVQLSRFAEATAKPSDVA